MDPATILADVGYVLSIGKLALAAAEDAAPFLEAAWQLIVNKTGLTDAERASLQVQENIYRGQLNANNIAGDGI